MSWDKVVQKSGGGEDRKDVLKLRFEDGDTYKMRILDEVPVHYQDTYIKSANAGKGAYFPYSKEMAGMVKHLNAEAGKKVAKFSDKFLVNVLVYDAPVIKEGKKTREKKDQVMVLEGGVTMFLPLRQLAENPEYGDLREYDVTVTRSGEKTQTTYTVTPARSNTKLPDDLKELAEKERYDLEAVTKDFPPIEVQLDIAKGKTFKDAWAKHKNENAESKPEEDGGETEELKKDGKKLSADDFDALG